MYDKFHLHIPFDDRFVTVLHSSQPDDLRGWVDFRQYDFKGTAPCRFDNGQVIFDDPKCAKFDTISSGISGMAVAFFPEGNGFNHWPHVVIKASPAKILQGHNVFGSEDPRPGVMQMLANLRLGFPKLFAHLDIQATEICYIDCTYSARIAQFHAQSIFRLFESMATAKQSVNARWVLDGYLQLGAGSEYVRAKLYLKLQELLDDLKHARKRKERHRIEVLSDVRLQEFAQDLMRFEATLGHRKLKDLGIPLGLFDFLRFNDQYYIKHRKPLCQYLWEIVFNPLFTQLEGHTMSNVDDSHIKLKIDAKFIRIKDKGRICRRKADAIFRTYEDICRKGYDALALQGKSQFFDNVNCLVEAGICRAFLKSIDPFKPNENIVPLVQLIKIDFSKQRPDWYEEPKAGFDNYPERQLRLVS